eukprot:CAMPEP_0116143396 /NCGR_PEP_ID=MMETSP0329-20121206/15431_1 /TAXON_ID=697910 /ORGANISM="Pseudo-nitzschia arenysensis, Strain B593" /LENGTH=301 /DNA_ID=CAMNT_0003638719 /DNA_START=33 /DNA_END=938 /DNA_ORIENTATION=+
MTDKEASTTEAVVESGAPKPSSPIDILLDLDDPSKKPVAHESFLFRVDPDDPACGEWGREQMRILKSAALSSKTVYSYCFVQSSPLSLRAVGGWCLVAISLVVQIVIPLGIVVLLQPVAKIEDANQFCPRRSNGLTKFLGFMLSAYFVVLTLGLCTNKLRGLNFLNQFVFLDPMRQLCIKVGIFAQCIGIFVASLAQYLLFIGNGNNYVALLLQSLAMQFCLTVDQNIVNHQVGAWTASRLKAITGDEFIATQHGGMGEANGPMPAATLKKVAGIVNSEKVVLVVMVVIGLFFSTCLAVCM